MANELVVANDYYRIVKRTGRIHDIANLKIPDYVIELSTEEDALGNPIWQRIQDLEPEQMSLIIHMCLTK